jgi:hypothetical protein
MFRQIEYPQATSNQVTVRIVRDQPTGDSTCDTASVGDVTETRSVVYPNSIRVEVAITLPPPPIKEKKPLPIRKPKYVAPVREIQAPWQAKWRLKQQRPRDGLGS